MSDVYGPLPIALHAMTLAENATTPRLVIFELHHFALAAAPGIDAAREPSAGHLRKHRPRAVAQERPERPRAAQRSSALG